MTDKYRRWWADDKPPSSAFVALVWTMGVAGLFAAATAVLSALIKSVNVWAS
jgi:hypothetical protein